MEQGPRRSVAELAGKFSCQMPHSTADEGNKPVRKRPPRTLQLPTSNNAVQGQDEQKKSEASSHPPRKNRNSALIEKLQASLVLSPTTALPSPLSPGAGKPPAPSLSPHSPISPVSPIVAPKPSEKETPTSFETPAEGNVLLNINKGRARHSIKRRPPSRRLRKSSGDEGGTEDSTSDLHASKHTATEEKENDVFEKQKVQNEEVDSASMEPEQNQPEEFQDSEQNPPEKKESEVCVEIFVTAEDDDGNVNEEKSDQPLLASVTSECTKKKAEEAPTEAPSDSSTEAKEQDEEERQQRSDPMEECEGSDQ